jgi:serine/threonine-protein kinase
VAAPAKLRRRRWPVVAALALGVVIGAVWSTASILSNLADDAEAQAQTSAGLGVSGRPAGGQPSSATAHGATKNRATTPQQTAEPIGAETNPYVPAKLCGTGYLTIDSAPLRSDGVLLGSVYVLADETGRTCVVTLKAGDLGEESAVSAYLEPEGGRRVSDDGDQKYYAGPVRAQTAGACIRWGGAVDDVAFDSELEHCQ